MARGVGPTYTSERVGREKLDKKCSRFLRSRTSIDDMQYIDIDL